MVGFMRSCAMDLIHMVCSQNDCGVVAQLLFRSRGSAWGKHDWPSFRLNVSEDGD